MLIQSSVNQISQPLVKSGHIDCSILLKLMCSNQIKSKIECSLYVFMDNMTSIFAEDIALKEG